MHVTNATGFQLQFCDIWRGGAKFRQSFHFSENENPWLPPQILEAALAFGFITDFGLGVRGIQAG